MIAAIVLAAGESTRMGSPKALLPDSNGRSFVAHLVRTFGAAGVQNVTVVTGSRHDDIARALEADGLSAVASLARNPDPTLGQLSSVWVGLDRVMGPDLEAVLVIPVDTPLVDESTVRSLVDAWHRTGAPIVRPASGDRHGHPVLFARSMLEELRRAPLEKGAKAVVRAHESEVLNVQVEDAGCLMDVDTPEDYERLLRL